MIKNAILLWLGITLGNLVYHGLIKKNWAKATEISFYQGFALGMFVTVAQ